MGTETTKRRCIKCKKLLLDEKLPLCRRCWLETRNRASSTAKFLGIAGIFVSSLILKKGTTSSDTEETA